MGKNNDILVGLITLALSVAYYLMAKSLTGLNETEKLGSIFYPSLLALIFGAFSIILIVQGIYGLYKSKNQKSRLRVQKQDLTNDSSPEKIRKICGLSPTMVAIIIAFLYLPALNILGYLIATPLALAALLLVMNVKKVTTVAGVSLGTTLVLYFMFAKVLNVLLP
ncbi:MAG: tripartite tricarboxylate transporter TctB family protein [Peptococcaceae bacterium]|nr:tripartite tricarboxylate transporter TctB family protein [Peptococcaceae bacterium]